MAATIVTKQSIGAGPSNTTITNCRLNTDDTVNPGTTNPLVKPSAGINRSYWKTVFLNADDSPSGTINNCFIYTDGTIGWTGVTLYGGSSGSYTEATGTPGTSGDDSSVATADMSGWTSGAAKQLTGSLDNPATGRITDYVVMQADLTTSAVAGTLAAETITWQYDET